MFYDEFVRLCSLNNISRTKACVDCGISRTAWHKWECGATPNGATISKFAAYFNVPVGQFLGEDAQTEKPTVSGEQSIDMSDVDIAFYGGYKELSEDDQKTIRDMVQLMRERRKK